MKVFFAVTFSALLAGCGSMAPSRDDASAPVVINQLAPSFNSENGTVDVSVGISNKARLSLKSVQIDLYAYDVSGALLPNATGRVMFEGPYAPGASVGPTVFKRVWTRSDIRCLEVASIRATAMDYSTQSLVGPDANNMVEKNYRRICTADSL
jgi:hypothetical protein